MMRAFAWWQVRWSARLCWPVGGSWSEGSSLRHPGLAHVFDDALASLQESWIVALGAVSIAPEGEPRIEGKPGLDFGSRFIEPPKLHQHGSHIETSGRIVWVQFLGPVIQAERRLVVAEIPLGEGDIGDPNIGFRIVRTNAQRLQFMVLGFLGMTVEQFCETNHRVRGSQIRIQRQRALTFGNALGRALGLHFDSTQTIVRPRVVWRL